MARILLTGGTGFVGLNIAEALLRRGDDVVVFANTRPGDRIVSRLGELAGTFEHAGGDIRDPEALSQAAGGCDALIHAAAVTPGARQEADVAAGTVEVNVSGTINAVTAAGKSDIGRLVFLGSAAVYGAASCPFLSEDATPPRPEGVYAVSKFAAEQIARRIAALRGLDLRCVRIGSVFGPWEHETGMRDTLSAIYQATKAALCGEPEIVLPRPGRRDWIYSRDVAAAVLRVLDRKIPPTGIVNIGLGGEWQVSDWCRRLEGAFPATRFRLAQDGEAANIDFHGDTDRPPLDIARLVSEIGFEPEYGLDRAFDDYLKWLGQCGRLQAGENA